MSRQPVAYKAVLFEPQNRQLFSESLIAMSPTTKQYKITSQSGGRVIARFPKEDRSLLPKRVAELPKDTDEPRTVSLSRGVPLCLFPN